MPDRAGARRQRGSWCAALLLSRRAHRSGLGRSEILLDRLIAERFLARRVTLRDVVQDERLTRAVVGVDSERPRHRAILALAGSVQERVGGDEIELTPGTVLFVPATHTSASRSSGADVLEIEWDDGGLGDGLGGGATSPGTASLMPRGHEACLALAAALREAPSDDAARAARATLELSLLALRSLGLPVDPERARAVPPPSARDQALAAAMDDVLSDLPRSPMTVDLEERLGCSGRTLSRHVRDLLARYGLRGRGEGRWRGLRDTTRLAVAAIFLSHEDATPARVASAVGYGSVEALDHAFHAAGLLPPLRYRRALTAV